MPMELKGIVEMQAQKEKLNKVYCPVVRRKIRRMIPLLTRRLFAQFSFIAMTGTLVVVASGTISLKFLMRRLLVGADRSETKSTEDDSKEGKDHRQQLEQPTLTPSQKKRMKRRMKEQREREMLEYAQNANESKNIIGFPEDGGTSRSAIKVGRLIVKPTVLGYGSCGTVVFDGELDGRSVAVKRLLAQSTNS